MKQLRNYTEEAVRQFVDRRIPNMDVCQCETCRLDIMAIMLNRLPSHYIVTEKGALFAQLIEFDFQNRADFVQYLNEAVMTINENPRH